MNEMEAPQINLPKNAPQMAGPKEKWWGCRDCGFPNLEKDSICINCDAPRGNTPNIPERLVGSIGGRMK